MYLSTDFFLLIEQKIILYTGKLILTSVTTVLLTLLNTSNVRVYEAHFVNKEDFDYDGRGRDYIYLCLQPR